MNLCLPVYSTNEFMYHTVSCYSIFLDPNSNTICLKVLYLFVMRTITFKEPYSDMTFRTATINVATESRYYLLYVQLN